jgi:xanthine dehydrogenase accessory factor
MDSADPLNQALVTVGREALTDGRPRVAESGGRLLFADPVLPLPGLIVLGGGHVAKDLAPAALAAGFAVTVVDDRPDFAGPDRFPGAAVSCADPAEALSRMNPRPTDFIVIATRSHEGDLAVLRTALRWPAAYIGMIGSRRKVRTLKQTLLATGEVTTGALDWVRAPVGLDIGAETPAEIAVAIVAELIAVRRGGPCLPLSSAVGAAEAPPRPRPVPTGDRENVRVWLALADALERGEPCALATVVRVRGSTPRGPGAHMLVRTDGRPLGSVGGGQREAEVVRMAARCMKDRQPLLFNAQYVEEQDALCGGAADILIEPVP